MRRSILIPIVLTLLALAIFGFLKLGVEPSPREPNQRPNDWFWTQRAWPVGDIEPAALDRALDQAVALDAAGSTLRSSWIQAGPTNIGARVTDLAVHPTNPDLVYAAMASGGIFKSVDAGASWEPVFDEQAVLPVGAVALDPQAPETVYAGTGEANAASLSFFGRGVFKSTDGGGSWEHLGLEATRYIGRIVVDPTDGDRVYLAATGKLFGTNPERGVYRSLDAGESWSRVFGLTDSTACIDLAIDPQNPQRLYAAMWERVRGLTYRRSGGPSSGIWRSEDGGDSWHELTSGLPGGSNVGRIGISVCASQPDVLFAIYADDSAYFDGIYKSTNGGDSWNAVNDGDLSNMYRSFGWWFGNIRVDPSDPNHVIALGLPAYRSTNGGNSWSETGNNMHVDHHALAFAPSQPGRIYEGNDGGIYRSDNGASSWSKLYDQPTSQFYAIGIDYQNPQRLYGGTQDNGTLRTWTGGTDDWELIHGGDGFYTLIDPTNSNVIYAEYQYGVLDKSTNGGSSFNSATSGINSDDRRNWSTPVVMDPSDPATLYYGSYRVYRSTNGAGSWSSISGDLTGGDQGANFGTVTTIAVAPSDPDVLAAGTDDGRVWVSANGGGRWIRVDTALPERWVTRVAFDPADAALLYVTFSGLRWDADAGHVFRSEDLGANWVDITGNLPAAPANVVLADPDLSGRVYVGTDVGVYCSLQPGGAWSIVAKGLPRSPVLDLKLHAPTRKLVAGTHGRSMFTLQIDELTGPPSTPLEVGRLLPNHPNPFNPVTTLRFELVRETHVLLSIHDAAGRRLELLLDEVRGPGGHSLQWRPIELPSGVYLARLSSEGFTETRKLVLIR